ncbi:MAG: ferrous iron transport protein A [Clostridiales bacterium]|jgi:ferrous iron transport protein A|nr:ferrous iron transport protein A [Clostridiales bacterium]
MSLAQIQKDHSIIVSDIATDGILKRRLMNFGIVKDTKITVVKFAPLGDPIIIDVKGCQLAIRKSEAKYILSK